VQHPIIGIVLISLKYLDTGIILKYEAPETAVILEASGMDLSG
jgi:hypothetical protein